MKSIRILLGSCNRSVNNTVEAHLRDLCFERAEVDLARVGRIGEFIQQASCDAYEMILVAPWDLQPDLNRRAVPIALDQVCCALRLIRQRHHVPIIAIQAGSNDQEDLLDAGADTVLHRPLDAAKLRAEVEPFLKLPELAVPPQPTLQWSLVGNWLRSATISGDRS